MGINWPAGREKSRADKFGVDVVLELVEEREPLSSGSSLHGISQPRQNLDQGQRAQTRPPSVTARNVKGNS